MRRTAKWIALPILSVIALFLVLWALSPRMIGGVVRQALQERGLKDVTVDFGRPRIDAVRVERISFEVPGAASVRIEGADVGYRLTGLLDGRIDSLSVDSVRLATHADSAGVTPSVPFALPVFDLTPFVDALPTRGLDVSRVVFGSDQGVAWLPPMSLRVNPGAEAATATVVVAPLDPAAADRVMEVVIERGGRIEGVLAWDDPATSPALRFSLTRAGEPLTWTGRVQGDVAAAVEWFWPLTALDIPVSTCRVEAQVRISENPLDALHLDADLGDCRVGTVGFASGSVRGRFMRTANGVASVTPVRLSVESIAGEGFAARSVIVHSGVDVDLGAGTVALPDGAQFRAAGLAAGAFAADAVNASLRESLQVALASPAGTAVVGADALRVTWRGEPVEATDAVLELPVSAGGVSLPAVRLGGVDAVFQGVGVRLSNVAARADGSAIVVDVQRARAERAEAAAIIDDARVTLPVRDGEVAALAARTKLLTLDAAGYRARLAGFGGRAGWGTGGVDATFDARLADAVPVNGRLVLAPGAPTGTLTVASETVAFGEDVERAALLIEGWPDGVDLVSGRAALEADVRIGADDTRAAVRVELDNVGGAAGDVYFSDASTTLELDVYPSLQTSRPAAVSVGAIDYGLALSAIDASVAIDGMADGMPRVVATDVRAEAFDGTLRVPRFESTGAGAFDVFLENIDLARLVGEERFPGLSMSGRVGGRVPVEIRHDGLYISRGRIESATGGVLHYDPGDVGAGSGAEILFKALKHFQYSVLRVEPEYQPDGVLNLAVHMEGTSEEIGRDQPIHFNVNVEQNILTLLESIRLVDGLNERIDRGVRQYYQRSQ